MTSSAGGFPRYAEGMGLWEHRGKVAVVGYGYSEIDRRWERREHGQDSGRLPARRPCRTPSRTPPDGRGHRRLHVQRSDGRRLVGAGRSRRSTALLRSALRLRGRPQPYLRRLAHRRHGAGGHAHSPISSTSTATQLAIGQETGKAAQAVGDGQANVLLMTYNMGNVPGRYKLEEGAYSEGGRKWSAPWGWMTSAMMQHASCSCSTAPSTAAATTTWRRSCSISAGTACSRRGATTPSTSRTRSRSRTTSRSVTSAGPTACSTPTGRSTTRSP